MRRFIAGVLLLLVPMTLNEVPGCKGSEGGGSGDINHPNVKPVNPSKTSRIPLPGDPPRIDGDDPRIVTFMATWEPYRDMLISWKINGRGETWKDSLGYWSHDEPAEKGDIAEFLVENVGSGGDTTCAVYVNGILFAPAQKDGRDPFGEASGGGDCRASIAVP